MIYMQARIEAEKHRIDSALDNLYECALDEDLDEEELYYINEEFIVLKKSVRSQSVYFSRRRSSPEEIKGDWGCFPTSKNISVEFIRR